MPNPHLKKVNVSDLPPNLQEARARSIELRGNGTFFEVFGNNPELYNWYIERFYKELFYSERIDQKIKELVRFRLSTLHGCKFCNQGNRKEALAAGISKEQIDTITDYQNGPFTAREKAVLALADEIALTNTNGVLTEEKYIALKAHFDDGAILELGMLMSLLSGVAKFIFAFDLVEKEDNCPFHIN